MTLDEFNLQERAVASDQLFACCGSEKWTALLLQHFPFRSEQELVKLATSCWYEECSAEDWKEAFNHHPKIGDIKSLEEKFASTKHLAGAEQAGVSAAPAEIVEKLIDANKAYEKNFGFIFIVFATGKWAEEMLGLLQDRLRNTLFEELHIAMGEQHKITLLRLQKLLNKAKWQWMKVSQLTTHVLDTSIGKPARQMTIQLQQASSEGWQTISQGRTNEDGRIADLLPQEKILSPSTYKLIFHTAAYFQSQQINSFYPQVEIQFSITDDQHYHVPLLINPFGYSTYRGS